MISKQRNGLENLTPFSIRKQEETKSTLLSGEIMNEEEFKTITTFLKIALITLLLIVTGLYAFSAINGVYDVWKSGKIGEAELARAESNRQIQTLEARAKMESAKHLAEAEIIRARGVAEANQIIGESLNGNEAYLRYLWIQGLHDSPGQVVYVPTETNLPILEASRLK